MEKHQKNHFWNVALFTRFNLTICLWFQSLLETFFFKSSKNGTFWAKLRRVKMAWTFLPSSAHFFCFKNWCKITSRKKSSLTSALGCAGQGVKLPFLSKKCIFWAENDIFSKSSFYTKMFSDPKYSFSVCQKYFFVISKKVNIFHRIEPSYKALQRQKKVLKRFSKVLQMCCDS